MVQKGLRPVIPASCPAPLAAIMRECWARNPNERPSFEQLKVRTCSGGMRCNWYRSGSLELQAA